MNRARIGMVSKEILPVERRISTRISPQNVKLCDLCGTLNHDANKECWTCRWHGGFSRDEKTITLAWKRLEALYEEVRLEHVTARRSQPVGDFGAVGPTSLLKKFSAAVASSWRRFQEHRELRMAQRHARLRSRMPSPPDQLGV